MAVYTQIDNPELYMQVKLYTGDGSDDRTITLDGDEDMQPDMVWLKERSEVRNHTITDSVRGGSKQVFPNLTSAEATDSGTVKSFTSDGFVIGTDDQANKDTQTFVAWCFKAGTAFSNDASATGVGNTDSSGSASSTAGFSISEYVGAGASLDIQVKHGLSVKPAVMIAKNIEEAGGNSWAVYHHKNTSAPETEYLKLDANTATTDLDSVWLDTEPTSAIFYAGDFSGTNRASDDFISYFWNEVQGYSKFGSYAANADSGGDGPFVFTGFKPAFVLAKNTNLAQGWVMIDNKRNTFNEVTKGLQPNTNGAETDSSANNGCDFLSNGFKIRAVGTGDLNYGSGQIYVYMAFAEAPFVNSNGVPCNAR